VHGRCLGFCLYGIFKEKKIHVIIFRFSIVDSFYAIFTVILKINTFDHKFIFVPQDTAYRDSTQMHQYYRKYFQFFVFCITLHCVKIKVNMHY